jgi:serine/threonine protein kinase
MASTFLGSGTYGCIFYPAIKCKNNKNVQGVGKIFSTTDERDTEFDIGKKLQKIDKKGSYLNIMVDECDVDMNYLLKAAKDVCNHVDAGKTNYNQLVYKDKGKDLYKTMKDSRYSIFDNTIRDQICSLIKGVQLLQKNGLVHLDIKPENILINESKKLLLIDFGLMRTFAKVFITKNMYILQHTYPVYPPEFKFFVALQDINRKSMEHNLDVHSPQYYSSFKKILLDFFLRIRGFKGHHETIETLSTLGIIQNADQIMAQINVFLDTLIALMKEKKLTHKSNYSKIKTLFGDNFSKKADVFSVGYVLLQLLNNQIGIVSGYKKEEYNKFKVLIKNMMSFNPFERFTIDESFEYYTNITQSKNKTIKQNIPISPKSAYFSAESSLSESNLPNTSTECMKGYKLTELKKMVDDHKLSKKWKKLKKEALCYNLVEQSKLPITSTKCMKQYNLTELKKMVDDYKLSKKWKKLRKQELCSNLVDHMRVNDSK